MRKIPNSELGRLTPQQYRASGKLPVTVVLDNVRSAGNVGSFFRTCDAFAVEGMVLCGITAVPPSKEIHKTALGAELVVPWRHFPSCAEAARTLRDEGFTLIAVEQAEGAELLEEFRFDLSLRYALVFGNEVEGVSQEVMDAADGAVEIPQAGTKHSLNVAVSGGAVLWEAFRQLWGIR